MTDTGRNPGEGLPENAGAEAGGDPLAPHTGIPGNGVPRQPGWGTEPMTEHGAPGYTYLDHPAPPGTGLDDEDDVLLMPGPQGSWSDPQPVPAPQPQAPLPQAGPGQPSLSVTPPSPIPVPLPPAVGLPITVEVPVEVPLETVSPVVLAGAVQGYALAQGASVHGGSPNGAFAHGGSVPGGPVQGGSLYSAPPPAGPAPVAPSGPSAEMQPSAEAGAEVPVPVASTGLTVPPAAESAAPAPVAEGAQGGVPQAAVPAPIGAEPATAPGPEASGVPAGQPGESAALNGAVPGEHPGGAAAAGGAAPPVPAEPTTAAPTPRRPLHMGPAVPEQNTGGVSVRSLADRGPAVSTSGPPTSGPEYLDVPRDGTGQIPAQQTGDSGEPAAPATGSAWPAAGAGVSQQSLIPRADSVPQPPESAGPAPEVSAAPSEPAAVPQPAPAPVQAPVPAPGPEAVPQAAAPAAVPAPAPAPAAEQAAAEPQAVPRAAPATSAPAAAQAAPAAVPQAEEAAPAAPRLSVVAPLAVASEASDASEAVVPAQGVPAAPSVGAGSPEQADGGPQFAAVPAHEPPVALPEGAAGVAQADPAADAADAAAPVAAAVEGPVVGGPQGAGAPGAAEQPAGPAPVAATAPAVADAPAAEAQPAGVPVADAPVADVPAQPGPEQAARPEPVADAAPAVPAPAPDPAPQPAEVAAGAGESAPTEVPAEAPVDVPAEVPADATAEAAPVEASAEAASGESGEGAVSAVSAEGTEAVEAAPAEAAPGKGRRGRRRAAPAVEHEEQAAPEGVHLVVPPAEIAAGAGPVDADPPAAGAEPQPRESAGRAPAAEPYEPSVRDAVHRVIRERRDIRNGFRSDPIPHDVLLRVLEAAHTAPSVGHSQPWDFVVIRSEKTREKMHELAMRQREAYAKSLPKARARQFRELKIEAILDTPVNIVVTADPTRGGRHTLGRHTQPQMAPYSSALAVENLWLAARAEGLGVGWVSFFDERQMVTGLGLPEHLEVVAYLCVGYVDEFPEEPELMQAGWSQRRPLSWVVHDEEYGNRALPGEQPHDLLEETLRGIRPLDAKALGEAWERQKRMTKPAGALGMLEIISAQLSGLSRQCPPPIPEPAAVAIFAGDHGVHAQGVTAWPQEVTAQMVANFLGGGAVCNAFANQVGAEVCVIDVGVACELPAAPGLLPRKVRLGTADFTEGPAMSREEALRAVEVGIETARDLVAAGNKALLTGEMGIANTTTSAALIAVFTGADPSEVTGRGTGINDEMHVRKVEVVRRALELHRPDPADPIAVLAAIGGLEHAAMVGLLLGAAALRTPVILDGVSAGAAALVARAIAPEVLAACIAGHRSAEPGHMAALTTLGLRPLVDLDLRLGEGTGALLALPLVQSAARVMHEVATFDAAGVTEKS